MVEYLLELRSRLLALVPISDSRAPTHIDRHETAYRIYPQAHMGLKTFKTSIAFLGSFLAISIAARIVGK